MVFRIVLTLTPDSCTTVTLPFPKTTVTLLTPSKPDTAPFTEFTQLLQVMPSTVNVVVVILGGDVIRDDVVVRGGDVVRGNVVVRGGDVIRGNDVVREVVVRGDDVFRGGAEVRAAVNVGV